MNDTKIRVHDYDIDLDQLYRVMYDESRLWDGVRLHNGQTADMTAIKWLLADLFGLPTEQTYNKFYGDARREVTNRFFALGWATKVDKHNNPVHSGAKSRTARYILHREIEGRH